MKPGARVWDLPTRLFHWLLVLLFAVSWWSAENREMAWHYRSGLALLGLLAFRLAWGFLGASTARLGALFVSPAQVLRYIRGRHGPRPGHNPLGACSVIAMLLALSVQIGTGLVATDVDGLESGPLSFLVSFEQGRLAAKVHGASFNVLLTLIALHMLAIGYYLLVRRRNLIAPMLTGRDPEIDAKSGEMRPAGPVAFVIAAALATLLAWSASKGFGL
ncbi:MAG TPA: cytochrome b/b6 domain-containing protein [Novosphingobium sp.]|nr:cytochrome b/b6 domain-containing protein [Novosphingobium sp.]